MVEVNLPNDWSPRPYQAPLWKALRDGCKRAIVIAHRRWGKDDLALHWAARSSAIRPGNYWHCLPEYAHARRTIWESVDSHTGRRRIDWAFPQAYRQRANDNEMFIGTRTGATWQMIGSDRYDTLVGAGPVGLVNSEYALANPLAWPYFRPMIQESDGWALFITTPRGKNHAHSLLELARKTPGWYAEVSTIEDTKALSQTQRDEALAEYIALHGIDLGTALFNQEYMCSFEEATPGAYFGAEMVRASTEGRICEVPVLPDLPVHTAWDLGKNVNNPIWCFQVLGDQVRIVDFYVPTSQDLDDWCRDLNDRGYHGLDFVPHDIMTVDWGAKHSRIERLRANKRRPHRLPQVSVAEGQQAARYVINRAVFDETRCEIGIEGLRKYRREWDAEKKRYSDQPFKDWSEHIGSAFRYVGLAFREEPLQTVQTKRVRIDGRIAPPAYQVDSRGHIHSDMPLQERILEMIERKRRYG